VNRFLVQSTTVGDLLAGAAQEWPDAEVIFPDQRASFRELDRRSASIARLLIASGVDPGDHVGVLLDPGLDMLATMFGIAKAGATIVPINERFRAAELRFLIGHADLTHLVTRCDGDEQLDFIGRLNDAFTDLSAGGEELSLAEAPALRRLLVIGDGTPNGTTALESFEEAAAAVSDRDLQRTGHGVSVSDPAFLMYTSGTSAEPKGCILSHEAFTRQGRSIAFTRYHLCPGDTFWCPLPLFHNGAIATLFACLSSGANYCHAGRFDPGVALLQLQDERCTHAIPTFQTIWLRVLDHPDFARTDLSSLRVLLNAGSPQILEGLQARVPHAVQLSNYGSTEAAGHFSMTLIDDPLDLRLNTGGNPLPGMEARIVDPDSGLELPAGVEGEIHMRGVSRFSGYYKSPELTAEVIDSDGWFRTGDLGTLDDDGRLAFCGRLKDMIKVGGENVAAAELEGFIALHPAVNIVQVVGAPDAYYTEVPAAFVELVPGASLTEAELIEHCLGQIATFKVPRYVRFVDEWPMSGTKIKKFTLREQISAELKSAGISVAPKLTAPLRTDTR